MSDFTLVRVRVLVPPVCVRSQHTSGGTRTMEYARVHACMRRCCLHVCDICLCVCTCVCLKKNKNITKARLARTGRCPNPDDDRPGPGEVWRCLPGRGGLGDTAPAYLQAGRGPPPAPPGNPSTHPTGPGGAP